MLLFKINIYLIIVFCFNLLNLNGQILINNNIQLTGDSLNKIQIKNVTTFYDSTTIINAKDIIINKHQFYVANAYLNDTIYLTSPISLSKYKAGMSIYFIAPDSNWNDTVYLKINGLQPKLLVNSKFESLFIGSLIKQNIVKAEFNGDVFIVSSPLLDRCPQGLVKVNNQYCIQVEENSATSFWAAANYCYNSNLRLCTWGEWYYSCQKAGLIGINNTTNNYEWVNSGTNSSGRVVVIGNGNCTTTTTTDATIGIRNYRCCYSLNE